MIRSSIIVVLLVLLAVLSDRVAREENQRYALELGPCAAAGGGTADANCLASVQTRSSWAWQFLHGLVDPLPQVAWTSETASTEPTMSSSAAADVSLSSSSAEMEISSDAPSSSQP